jgi:hypothetical protein
MHAESPGLVEYGKKRGKTELRGRKEGEMENKWRQMEERREK